MSEASRDREFDAVIAAMARQGQVRYLPWQTAEESKRLAEEAHKKDPRHIKALERRKKRKRGGPK